MISNKSYPHSEAFHGNTTAHFEVKKLQDGRLVGNELECAMVRRMTTPSVERPGPLGAAGQCASAGHWRRDTMGISWGNLLKMEDNGGLKLGTYSIKFYKWWILMGQFYT